MGEKIKRFVATFYGGAILVVLIWLVFAQFHSAQSMMGGVGWYLMMRIIVEYKYV